jgi:hypothetical protein
MGQSLESSTFLLRVMSPGFVTARTVVIRLYPDAPDT